MNIRNGSPFSVQSSRLQYFEGDNTGGDPPVGGDSAPPVGGDPVDAPPPTPTPVDNGDKEKQRLINEAVSWKLKFRDKEKEVTALQEAKMSETERTQAQLLRLTSENESLRQQTLSSKIEAAVASLLLNKGVATPNAPEAAMKLMDVSSVSMVDGVVTGVETAIESVMSRFPQLFVVPAPAPAPVPAKPAPPVPTTSPTNGGRPTSASGPKTMVEAMKMWPTREEQRLHIDEMAKLK